MKLVDDKTVSRESYFTNFGHTNANSEIPNEIGIFGNKVAISENPDEMCALKILKMIHSDLQNQDETVR